MIPYSVCKLYHCGPKTAHSIQKALPVWFLTCRYIRAPGGRLQPPWHTPTEKAFIAYLPACAHVHVVRACALCKYLMAPVAARRARAPYFYLLQYQRGSALRNFVKTAQFLFILPERYLKTAVPWNECGP